MEYLIEKLSEFFRSLAVHDSGIPYSGIMGIYRTDHYRPQESKALQPPFSLRIFESIPVDNSWCQGLAATSAGPAPVPIPLFPASYRTQSGFIIAAKPGDPEYLSSELCVDRLNDIHAWLWIVGRPMSARPLHLQRIKLREIFVTEQMDLHLVWAPKQIYLKPIPRFLLDVDFWEKHLCHNKKLYACAIGFLLSYTALIQHESDYRIAIETHLLPAEVTWSQWVVLVEQLLHHRNSACINRRYIYGELRLNRLNLIYRLIKGRIRGYLNSCTTYADFFRDNLNSLITLFAYFTIVLSAFEVGLGTQQLQNSRAFSSAAYGFTIFSIAAPLLVVAAVATVLVGLFYYNLIATLIFRRTRANAQGSQMIAVFKDVEHEY